MHAGKVGTVWGEVTLKGEGARYYRDCVCTMFLALLLDQGDVSEINTQRTTSRGCVAVVGYLHSNFSLVQGRNDEICSAPTNTHSCSFSTALCLQLLESLSYSLPLSFHLILCWKIQTLGSSWLRIK